MYLQLGGAALAPLFRHAAQNARSCLLGAAVELTEKAFGTQTGGPVGVHL